MASSNKALREKFKAFIRPTWQPKVELGDGSIRDSKYSGLPFLAPNESWPKCGECHQELQLFLQLNIASLPEPAKALLGLNSGLIQLFYCTGSECKDSPIWEPFSESHLVRVLLLDEGQLPKETVPLVVPEILKQHYFPASKIIAWKELDDFPSLDEEIELPRLSADDEDAYFLSEPYLTTLGDKLGGWPSWVQSQEYPICPKCQEQMHLVFQLDSNENVPWMWGDMGTGHITQCKNHRNVLAFGWACS